MTLQCPALYLAGYAITFDDLRFFRQWGSRTPGHPERRETARSVAAAAVVQNPRQEGFVDRVSDSGVGRWTVASAAEEGDSAPVESATRFGRFDSCGRDDFANQISSALRREFGGHQERSESV